MSQCLSTLLFAPVKQGYDREQRRRLYQYMRDCQFLKAITNMIGSAGPSPLVLAARAHQAASIPKTLLLGVRPALADATLSMAAADYMIRLVDDCTRLDASEVIVNSVLHAPMGKSLINWLLQVRGAAPHERNDRSARSPTCALVSGARPTGRTVDGRGDRQRAADRLRARAAHAPHQEVRCSRDESALGPRGGRAREVGGHERWAGMRGGRA